MESVKRKEVNMRSKLKENIGAFISGTSLLAAIVAGGSDPSVLSYTIVAIGLIGVVIGLILFEMETTQ